jgi:hypothetical protein
MKKTVVAVGVLTALSHSAMAANRTDVGLVGANGEVMLYYRDSDQIVVRSCAPNTVLGKKGTPVAEARRRCVGPENRVPIATFKRALRSMINLDRASILQPLTPEQVRTLGNFKHPDEQIEPMKEAMQKELDQIEAFIRTYGPADANLGRRDQLVADLAANRKTSAALKEANEQIDRTIDSITNNTLTVAQHSSDRNQFLFSVLKQFDPSKAECGIDELMNGTPERGNGNGGGDGSGARPAAWLDLLVPNAHAAKEAGGGSPARARKLKVKDRISHCAAYPGSTKRTSKGLVWLLVARRRDPSTGIFYEVWSEPRTGLIWSHRLDSRYSHFNAVALAPNGRVTKEKACERENEEARRAQAGITEKSFRLPTKEEGEYSVSTGIHEVLPGMEMGPSTEGFWTSSLRKTVNVDGVYRNPVVVYLPGWERKYWWLDAPASADGTHLIWCVAR